MRIKLVIFTIKLIEKVVKSNKHLPRACLGRFMELL